MPDFNGMRTTLDRFGEELQKHLRESNRNDDWDRCSTYLAHIRETHEEIERVALNDGPSFKSLLRQAIEHIDVAINEMEKTKSAFKSKSIAVARSEAERAKQILAQFV